jgi:hypothetical protein
MHWLSDEVSTHQYFEYVTANPNPLCQINVTLNASFPVHLFWEIAGIDEKYAWPAVIFY